MIKHFIKVYVIFLLNMLMKLKMNLLYRYEHKSINSIFFVGMKLNFNLELKNLFLSDNNCSVHF